VGAIEVLYGTEKVSFSELCSKEKTAPTMRFIVVNLSNAKDGHSLTLSDRYIKKKLLNLRPWEYFRASSDPTFRVDCRAVLQSLKPSFYAIKALMDSSLREIREGSKPFGFRCLKRMKALLMRRFKWSLKDHLIFRYVRWAIGELEHGIHTLDILGLSRQDLDNPLLKGRLYYSLDSPGITSHLRSDDITLVPLSSGASMRTISVDLHTLGLE